MPLGRAVMQSNKTLLATIIGGLLLCVSLQPIQAGAESDKINKTIAVKEKTLDKMKASIENTIHAVDYNSHLKGINERQLTNALQDYKNSDQLRNLAHDGTKEEIAKFNSMITGVKRQITEAKGATIKSTIAKKFYETLSKLPDSFGGKMGKAGLKRINLIEGNQTVIFDHYAIDEHEHEHEHRNPSLQEYIDHSHPTAISGEHREPHTIDPGVPHNEE